MAALRQLLSEQATQAPRVEEESGNDNAQERPIVTDVNTETYSERRRPDRRGAESPMLRVDPARIDQLTNSIGELVFDHA